MNAFHRYVVILFVAAGLSACASPKHSASSSHGTQAPAAHDVSSRAAAEASISADCNLRPDPDQLQYIIGYGSLMQDESRKRTSPQAGPAHPIEVSGYRRGWFAKGASVGFSTTFLGAVPDPKSHLNAVIYRVETNELTATDQREASYCRKGVPSSDIKTLETGPFEMLAGQAWIYANRQEAIATPSAEFPIVQSYVDIFLSGCLEQEQRFELKGFAQRCLATTEDWSKHWVNDRLYPRRPFIFQPRSRQIDSLLSQRLPEYFSYIKIE